MGHKDRTRPAFSMVELLIAVTILALCCVPVLFMANHNVETARIDRVRLEVESICHNILERFGQASDNLLCYLAPIPGNPSLLASDNLFMHFKDVYNNTAAGHLGINKLVTQHSFRMRVELKQGVTKDLALLTCRVSWISDRERQKKTENLSYARFILYDHTH